LVCHLAISILLSMHISDFGMLDILLEYLVCTFAYHDTYHVMYFVSTNIDTHESSQNFRLRGPELEGLDIYYKKKW
jgi:hypothetical protein